jgi:hypothetical protein
MMGYLLCDELDLIDSISGVCYQYKSSILTERLSF